MKGVLKAAASTVAIVIVLLTLSSCGLIFITESFDDRREVSTADTYTAPSIPAPELPAQGSDGEEYDPKTMLASLPDYDFGGGNFIVITLEDSLLFRNTNEDLFFGASEKVRSAVADKFDLKFYHETPGDTELSEYIGAVTVGDYYADLLLIPYSEVEALKAALKITSFDNKAFFVEDFEFFNYDVMSQMNGEDGIYAVYSDSMRDLCDSYCLFFRQDKADREELYTAAKEGKLTWDTLLSAVKSGGIVYGDGGAAVADRYLAENDRLIYDEEPYLRFVDGEAAVMIAPISDIEKLSDMEEAFGVLPLPKKDVRDGYKGYSGGLRDMDVFVCPVNPASPELTVLVIDSFCASAGEAYKAEAVDHYADYVRDEASYTMLDLIFSPEGIEY